MKQQELLLSVGIIFKNEIRCLERCLKSFLPLKAALPDQVEIVMADTGSDDGSWEVAERYADILFQFPWVNDFAAARNAVMDRCSGQWFMTVDADEWLDEDIGLLCQFLREGKTAPGNICEVMIRNYTTAELDWNYSEFMGSRMVRMSTGIRYTGAIHEHFAVPEKLKSNNLLTKVLLHHDGYVCLNDGSAAGKEKLKRNVDLLEKELEKTPHNMRLLMQRLDCWTDNYEEKIEFAEKAIVGIREQWPEWQLGGPAILHHAIHSAKMLRRPEVEEWVALADEVFPNSLVTKIDIQFNAAENAWNHMDCPEVIFRSERYLRAVKDFRDGNYNPTGLSSGTLDTVQPHVETNLRMCLAMAYLYEGRPDEALRSLDPLDYDTMDPGQAGALGTALLRLHTLSTVDVGPLIRQVWAKMGRPIPSKAQAEEREKSFVSVCAKCFSVWYRNEEAARMQDVAAPLSFDEDTMRAEEWEVLSKLPVYRHAYTLFLPLMGQCELATAAAVLTAGSLDEISQLLGSVKSFQALPISALRYALECGAPFPVPENPLTLEEMDRLAGRLMRLDKQAIQLAVDVDIDSAKQDAQALCWARGLILAAVQVFPWTAEDADEEQGVALSGSFAEMERAFIPQCFAPEALKEDRLFMLPPMHRFGWYCAQAFAALDTGDTADYVRLLREGLAACEGVKDMVEFLIDHTPQLQAPKPSAELAALAEQIRTILAAYPADDPAVAGLKASEAYQRVAYLIEG